MMVVLTCQIIGLFFSCMPIGRHPRGAEMISCFTIFRLGHYGNACRDSWNAGPEPCDSCYWYETIMSIWFPIGTSDELIIVLDGFRYFPLGFLYESRLEISGCSNLFVWCLIRCFHVYAYEHTNILKSRYVRLELSQSDHGPLLGLDHDWELISWVLPFTLIWISVFRCPVISHFRRTFGRRLVKIAKPYKGEQ